jgi:PAS domain S-box-containing protein
MQFLVLITVTPIILLAIHNSLERRRFGERQMLRESASAATRLAENMENQVAGIENLLRAMAHRVQEHDDHQGSLNAYLDEIRQQFPQLTNLCIVAADGSVKYSGERPPGYRNVSFADRPWFRQVLATRSAVTSGYLQGRITGRDLVVIAMPIISPAGAVTGVIYAALNLDKLQQLFMRESLPAGHQVFLLDSTGIVLSAKASADLHPGKLASSPELRTAVLRQPQGSRKITDEKGIERIYFFKTVAGTTPAYHVGIGMPTSMVLADANDHLLRTLVFILLMTVFSLGISHFFGANLIARPIEIMVDTAAKIAAGDFTARTGLLGKRGEIGQLSTALDAMANALLQREQQRQVMEKALIHSEMEYRVLFEGNPHPMWIYDRETLRFLAVNHATVRHYGYTADEFQIMRVPDLNPPETRQEAETMMRELPGLRRQIGIREHRGQDGRRIQVEITTHDVTFADRPARLVLANDVSERLQAEQSLLWQARVNAALAEIYLTLVASHYSLEALAEKILLQSCALTGSQHGYVSTLDPVTRLVSSLAVVGHGTEAAMQSLVTVGIDAEGRYPGLRGAVFNAAESLEVNDLQALPDVADLPPAHVPLQRLLSVPVMLDGKVVGQIMLCNAPTDYDGKELEAVNRLADFFALALQRRRTEDAVLRYQSRLKAMAAESLLIQERERRHLAQVLHDQIGQSLALTAITLGRLGTVVATREQQQFLAEIQTLVQESIAATRSLTIEISPPILYQIGLQAALASLVEAFRERYGLPVVFYAEHAFTVVAEESRVLLYYVVRELLMNVLKHAKATQASVTVQRDENLLRIVVADDGVGMDPQSEHVPAGKPMSYGLFSIYEQLDRLGGSMEIDAAPGQGTQVTILAPIFQD